MRPTYSRRTCSSTSASKRASCHGTGDVAAFEAVSCCAFGSGSISRSALTGRPIERLKPATMPSVRTSAKRTRVPRRDIAESSWAEGCWSLAGGAESIVHGRCVGQCGGRLKADARGSRRAAARRRTGAQQLLQDDLQRARPADRESLPLNHAELADRGEDRFALDAFGGGFEFHRLRQLHDSRDSRARTGVACDV